MSNNFNFELISKVISGPNSIKLIYKFIKEKRFKKIGLVIDKNLYDNSNHIKFFLVELKKSKKLKKILFFNPVQEPTYTHLDYLVNKLKKEKNNNFDCLVAIGGGSTIDLAKGISTLLKNKGNALKFRGFPKNLKSSVPLIAVPSTTGTGSELAYNAVFTDLKSNTKLGINTKNNYPILSVLDPKIITNSPQSVILNSSLGALIRSIDSRFNLKSTKISKIFSENSFKLLFNNLPKVLKDKNNLKYLSNMQWGAYLSIAALLNSSSGPAGTFSYYLSSNYNIPQGLGYAIAGTLIFQRNHEKGYYEYYKLFNQLEKKSLNKKISIKQKSAFIISSLLNLIKSNKINLKKKGVYIDKKNIFNYTKKTFSNKKSNNPIKLNNKDLKIIINRMLKI